MLKISPMLDVGRFLHGKYICFLNKAVFVKFVVKI